MANNGGVPSLGRVKLTDLIPSEGLPSESYKVSVSTLSNSFAQFSAAIIQFPSTDTSLLRSCLDSARLYFHQRPPPTDIIHSATTPHDDSSSGGEWCKTSGYYANPQLSLEIYDYRPGLTPPHIDPSLDFPPSALPDIFALMAKTARHVLDAITFYLNLRSSAFAQVLDNLPLRNREVSSSVLSVCCHGRQSFQDDAQMVIYQTEHDHHVDKSLVTIVVSDKPGLHVRDFQGRWVLVDGDLGPQDAVVYPGLALYQATAGYVNPALHRTEISNMVFGRFSLAFKLMPKSLSSLSCSEMRDAGHGVEAQFQLPVPVDDFMQRSHSTDQLFNRQAFQSIGYPTPQDGSMKPLSRRRKSNSRCKPLPPSKRLRLEAQRVLKERVQDIADKKGFKLRFCSLKECENHMHLLDSPCANIRMEIKWPAGVPFVHPHDLPNKAKISFLEAYEPGWTATHDVDFTPIEPGRAGQHSANCN